MVDETWDDVERHTVWAYLSSGTMVVSYVGLSQCRFCAADNGGLEYTDGVYQWPEGLAHYVSEHNVRLPAEFIAHAVDSLHALETKSASLDWWLAQTT